MSTRWTTSDIDRYSLRRRQRLELPEPSRPPLVKAARRQSKHKNEYAIYAGAYCRELGIPEPASEHHFHATREWRFDLAWPAQRIAIEVNGGNWINGAHARPRGLIDEYEKGNAAVMCGWRVLRTEPGGLANALQMVKELLGRPPLGARVVEGVAGLYPRP
jgi:hypothetical protein